jgi:hypothetical protein
MSDVLLKVHSSLLLLLLLLLLQEAVAGVQERPCGDKVQALLLRELRTQVSCCETTCAARPVAWHPVVQPLTRSN